MSELADSVLEHLLCTPSHAVPALFPAPAPSSQRSLNPGTPTDSATPNSDNTSPAPATMHANHAGSLPASNKGPVADDAPSAVACIASLARSALMAIHCEALIAGNIDAEDSLELATQVKRCLASAAAALCPADADALAATACVSGGVSHDSHAAPTNGNATHGLAVTSSKKGRERGKKQEGGRIGVKNRGASKAACPPEGTTPPWLPAEARPLQRCIMLRPGSNHALKLNINMPGQDKYSLLVYFQVRCTLTMHTCRRRSLSCTLLFSTSSTCTMHWTRTAAHDVGGMHGVDACRLGPGTQGWRRSVPCSQPQ
jgi:hypothetical protein